MLYKDFSLHLHALLYFKLFIICIVLSFTLDCITCECRLLNEYVCMYHSHNSAYSDCCETAPLNYLIIIVTNIIIHYKCTMAGYWHWVRTSTLWTGRKISDSRSCEQPFCWLHCKKAI